MATLGTMKTRIARELQIDATEFDTDITDAIFSAIDFYNDNDFWFLETAPATVLLTATGAYSMEAILPGRSQIHNLQLVYNQNTEAMFYRTPGEFATLQSQFTGDPAFYTVNADQLLVEPIPSRTFTAIAWYSLRKSITSSNSASGVWTTEAEEIIRLHAKVDLLTNRIKDYPEAMQIQGRLTTVLEKADEKTVQRRGSRRIKPCL